MPPPSPTTTQTHNTTQVSRSECDNNNGHEDVGNRSNNKHTTGDSSSGGHSGGLLPDEALQCYGHLLTTGECNELAKMGVVYYFGQASAARQRRSASTAPSQGLQDDGQAHVQLPQSTMRKPSVDALLIPHEHIAFRYEIVKVLGSGAFGHVVHAIDHATGDHVAIKLMPMSRKILSMARQEVRMLQLVSAKDSEQRYGIVHMRDTFSFRGHVCIVFDLLGINLYDVMRLRKFEPMPLRLVRRIAAQLLVSLAFLWREGIVHADIKPENVVLQRSDSSVVKLIDLGTAAVDTSCVLTYAQSRFYRAPEVILGLPCGRPMDMWSFGCVLCELATGTPLFAGVDEYDQLHCIMEYLGAPPQALAAVCRRRHDFFDDALQPRPCCAAHASAADGEKDEDDVGHTGKTSQRIQQQHHNNNKAAAADADAAATIDDDDSNNNSDADGDAGGGGGGTVAHAALCNAKPHPRRVPASRTLHKMLGLSHDDAFVDFVMLFLRWDPQQRAPPRVAMRHAWVCEEFVAQAAPEAATATPAAEATQAATQAATTSSDSNNNNAPPRPSTTRTAAAAADAATTEAAAAAAAATASDANKDSVAATAAASAPLPPMMASSPLHKSTTSSEAATSPHTTVVVDVTSTAPAAPPPAVPTSPARPPPPSKSFAALTHTQDNIVANTDASAAIAAAAAYASLQSSSSSSLSTTATTATTASSLSQTHDTKQASNTIVSAYEVRPPSPLLSVPPVASAAPTTTTTLVVPATQARQQRCASATVAQPQAAAVAAATRQQPQHKRTISINSPSSTTDVAAAAAAPASPPSCFFFAPVERAPPPSTAPVVRALPSTSSSASSAAAMAQSQTHTKQSSTMTPTTTTTTAVTSAAPTSRVSPLPLPSQPSQPSPLSSSPTHMHMSLPTAQQQQQQQHTVVAASHDDVAPASRVAHTSPLHSHKGDDNDKGTCADSNNKTKTAATVTTAAHNKPAASSLTSNNGNRTAVNSTDTSTAVNDKSATFTSGVAAVTVRRTNKTFAANKMGAAAAAAASRTELHAKPKTTTTTTSSSNSSSNNSNNSNNSSNDTYGRVDKQRKVGGGDSQRSGEAECNDTEARVRVGDGIDKNAKASTLADKGNNNSNNNKNNNNNSSSSTVPPSTQVAKVGDGKAAPQPQATAALYTALTTPHAGAVVPRRRTVRPLPSSVLSQAAAATSARAASIAITPTTAAFATAAVAVTSPSHSTIMSVADSKATQLLSSSIGNSDSRSSGSAAVAGYKRNSDTCGVGYAARTTAWPASLPPLQRLSEGGEAMAQARLLRR